MTSNIPAAPALQAAFPIQYNFIAADIADLTGEVPNPLDQFSDLRSWVAWKGDGRKIPVNPAGGWNASSTKPQTWGTRAEAEARMQRDSLPGIGIILGDTISNPDLRLAGIDLDSCFDDRGRLLPWAADVLTRFPSYVERSPSGTGVKVFFTIAATDADALAPHDDDSRAFEFSRGNHCEIALFIGRRFFTVTGKPLKGSPDRLATIDRAALDWLIEEAGPEFLEDADEEVRVDGSARLLAIACDCRREGTDFEEYRARVMDDPDAARHVRKERGSRRQERALRRAWVKADGLASDTDDFEDLDAAASPLFASAADWLQTPPTPREWLVRDMVPMGTVTLLTGHGGTGKSLLALQLAVAAATGDDWIGKRIEQPGAVVFFSAEDSVNDLKLRLTDICNGTMTDMSELGSLYIQSFVEEDPVLANFSKEGKIQKTKLFRQVSQFIEAINPKLLVLDTLSNIHTGNEVDKQVAVQFINLLKPIAAKHNCAVLLLAHPSMSGMESGEFGSRGWHNTVRSRLFLKKDKDSDLRVLTVEKQNYGATGGEMFLRWVRGAFDHGDDLIDTTEAETEFLRMLDKFTLQGRNVSAAYSPTYAPAAFSKDRDCAIQNKRQLADAMNNLLTAGKITVEEFGSESRRRTRLVIVSNEA